MLQMLKTSESDETRFLSGPIRQGQRLIAAHTSLRFSAERVALTPLVFAVSYPVAAFGSAITVLVLLLFIRRARSAAKRLRPPAALGCAGNSSGHLLTLALALCALGLSRANAQPAAPAAQESSVAVPTVSATAKTDKSKAPLLLELTEPVTTEKARLGTDVHFRVSQDFVEDGLVLVTEGTGVRAKVESIDKHGGPEEAPVLLLRFGTVKTVTGEQLPIAPAMGNQNGDLEKLTVRFEDWPGIRGFFGRAIHYLAPGTRKVVGVTLPPELDYARLLAAQPTLQAPPGHATVYFLPPESARTDVWCGAVEIGAGFSKVLLRPGNYSCRVERFSPQESYLDFNVADGGTYYLLSESDSVNLAQATAAEAVDRWNKWIYVSSRRGKEADLTKVGSEIFRKLPPFVSDEQPGDPFVSAWFWSWFAQRPTPDAQESLSLGSAANSAAKTTGSNSLPTTSMVLELTEEVTSKKAKFGDEVLFHVVEDVIKDGLVVVAKGTPIRGRVERVDRRGGWMKDGGLTVRIEPVRTLTGEELAIAGTLGQKGGKKDVKGGLAVSLDPEVGAPFTTPIILPFLPFIKGDDYVLRSGTWYKVELTLPPQFDRATLLAAQPGAAKPPGYATVYSLLGVWCGAVYIGAHSKVILRPGNYSCRVETFSPQESYVEFALADGGTYYLVVYCADKCAKPDNIRPALTTAAGAADMWTSWPKDYRSGKTKDLTKIDPEAFRKLPPFLRVEQ